MPDMSLHMHNWNVYYDTIVLHPSWILKWHSSKQCDISWMRLLTFWWECLFLESQYRCQKTCKQLNHEPQVNKTKIPWLSLVVGKNNQFPNFSVGSTVWIIWKGQHWMLQYRWVATSLTFQCKIFVFIDREAREIMYLVASVRPCVDLSAFPSSPVWIIWPLSKVWSLPVRGFCLCVCNQGRIQIISRMRSIGF